MEKSTDEKKKYMISDEEWKDTYNLYAEPDNSEASPALALLHRIVKYMREARINVDFRNMEEALTKIHDNPDKIKDINDLKELIKPIFVKIKEAEQVFSEAFNKAMEKTYGTKNK